ALQRWAQSTAVTLPRAPTDGERLETRVSLEALSEWLDRGAGPKALTQGVYGSTHGGLSASRACPSCGGTGKPRRRRRASTSEDKTAARMRRMRARNAARRACRACNGS